MRNILVCAAAVGLLAMTACSSPSPRLNAPPHGKPETTSEMQSMYTHMTDNALLADMTVSDIHFLPHRALLSSLGEERLSRLALLMQAYGGTIRLSTNVTDEGLVDARINEVLEFLCQAGIDATAETVRLDMPGGRGLDATEVILIKTNEGTYRPEASGGSTGLGGQGEE
ncbi:MAG: hypothetical protein PVJ57_14330 [Phycisphaerae bacterium]|jgi:hypothetical protein